MDGMGGIVNPKRALPGPPGKLQVNDAGLERVVSGGQTGADRAALDVALELGISHGGWCPRGRQAEDGSINALYVLRETPTPNSAQRTAWNVRDSDGTVILSVKSELRGGAQVAADCAVELDKPCLRLSRAQHGEEAADRLRRFIKEHHIRVLNVAGPRTSEEPGVYRFVRNVLTRTLKSGWQAGSRGE
jgi:hypothetical protein